MGQNHWVKGMNRNKRIGAKRPQSSRNYGRKKSKTYKKMQVLRPLSSKDTSCRLAGPSTVVRFLYSTRFSINPGVGGLAGSQVFRLGSIFDPDFTNVGHQPVGHDQYALLYERYQVYEIEYHVEFCNRDTAQNQCVGVRFSDVTDTSTDRDVNIENGYVEWAVLGPSQAGPRTFRGKVYNHAVHGVTYKQYMGNDDYGAQFGSNPVEDAFMVLFADGLGDDSDAVDGVVSIVYKTKLTGTKLTALS